MQQVIELAPLSSSSKVSIFPAAQTNQVLFFNRCVQELESINLKDLLIEPLSLRFPVLLLVSFTNWFPLPPTQVCLIDLLTFKGMYRAFSFSPLSAIIVLF